MNRGVSEKKKQQVIGTRIVSSMPCLQLGDSVTKSSAKVTKKKRRGGERGVSSRATAHRVTLMRVGVPVCLLSFVPAAVCRLIFCFVFFFINIP